jgi:hypothetical protein
VGPLSPWDTTSVVGTSNKVNGLAAMASQILVFHDGYTERIRGTIPPAVGVTSDMYVDTLSSHVGCPYPASICYWLENVIFVDPNGVQITDGASVRCLTDQGGIRSLWYDMYKNIRSGAQIRCEVIQDQLVVFVPTTFAVGDLAREDYPTLLVCDLYNRTWSRFSNVYPSCLIPIVVGAADIAWCGDNYTGGLTKKQLDARAITPSPMQLSFFAPMFHPQQSQDPAGTITLTQQYDGDGDAVLPHLETGWVRIGSEIPKEFVNLDVTHVLQVDHTVDATVPVMRASCQVEPLVQYMHGDPAKAIVPSAAYTRDRFMVNDTGYGIRVGLDSIAPVGVGAVFDIQIVYTEKDVSALR